VKTPTKQGDVFRDVLAGAGGGGDPFTHDPERVLRDGQEEKFTPEYARREYGVAIDPATGTVLRDATARLRARRDGDSPATGR
jgi:N-methylhydantoinase B